VDKNTKNDENIIDLFPLENKDFIPFPSDFQDQIEPSFQSSIQSAPASDGSSNPLENLANIPLNFEQLEYLQQLKAALKPQVIVNSIPQVETKTVYKTNTLKLIQDNKEFSTGLLTPIGLTRVTKFEIVTSTLPLFDDALPPVPAGLPPLQGSRGILNDELPSGSNTFGLNNIQGVEASTQLVVKTIELSTKMLKTSTQEYRIIFRNTPITTTLTNTRLVETVITSLTTVTQTIAPSINPFARFIT
jgi:hypothetical protein